MANLTIGGYNYTTDSKGNITSGPAGSVGINIASIAGYNGGSGSNGSSGSSNYTPPTSAVAGPIFNGNNTGSGGYTVVGNGYSGSGSPGNSYTPPISNNNTSNQQDFRSWAAQNNVNYNYDGNTNTLNINGQNYKNGYVPGLSLINGKNYVTDSSLLSSSLGNTGTKVADVPMVNSNNGLDMEKIQALLAAVQPKYEIPEMPKYNLPNLDIGSLIAPTQGPAITANAADTIYLPTANFKNRALQAQQAQATLANQNYQNQLNAWGSQVDAIQNQATAQRAALSALLPYVMQTADQQAADEAAKALDASKLERQDWYIQSLKDEAALKQKLTESQIAENQAQAAKTGRTGTSGGGGGGINDKQAKATSKSLSDAIIADMEAGWSRMVGNGADPTSYSYQAHITGAQNKGVWDKLSATDRSRVQKAANALKNKKYTGY